MTLPDNSPLSRPYRPQFIAWSYQGHRSQSLPQPLARFFWPVGPSRFVLLAKP
jgi:hypothetical protein